MLQLPVKYNSLKLKIALVYQESNLKDKLAGNSETSFYDETLIVSVLQVSSLIGIEKQGD